MKVKLTKRQILDLYQGLSGILSKNETLNYKIIYAIKKNQKLIENEFEAISASMKPGKEINEFENKRVELARVYSDKDQEDNPIILNKGTYSESFKIIEKKIEFNEQVELLRKEYKEYLDIFEKNNSIEELKKEIEIDLHGLKKDDIEKIYEDKEINCQLFNSISYFIEE